MPDTTASPAVTQAPLPVAVPVDFPLQQSTAYWTNSVFGQNLNFPRYIPDQLIGKKGFEIYDKMADDEQVKAVLKFKRDAMLSRQWDLVFDKDTSLSQEEQDLRRETLRGLLCKVKGGFTLALQNILRAMRHGFSINEKIFDLVEVNGKAYYACVELRKKPPFTFYFKTDAYGTLTEFGQGWALGSNRILDLKKFVHFVCNPDDDEFYGRSELRAAYRSWYMKDVVMKLQALWLERMAGGFLAAQPEKDVTLQPADRAALESALANVKTISGIIMPPGVTANVVQATGNGEAFSAALENYDLGIAKALLVPNLFGVSHTGSTGSYSQSQTQLETFFWTLNSDTNRLEACVQEQYVMDLCEANYGDGEYPVFQYKPASEDFVKWVVGQWTTLVSGNAVITTEADEAHLREILNMPPRGEDDEPLVTPAQEAAQNLQKAQAQKAASGALNQGDGDATGAQNSFTRKDGKVVAHTRDGKPLTCTVESFTRAVQRVAFTVIEQKTDAIQVEASRKIAGILTKSVAKTLAKTAEYLADPAKIGNINVLASRADGSRLKNACVEALDRGYKLGESQANDEIQLARRRAGHHSRHVYRALRGADASGFLDANGHRMAGNLADGAGQIIQQELLNALKSGDRPELVAANIYRRLIAKGYTDMDAVDDNVDDRDVREALGVAVGAETEKGTLAYLNTLTRTNIFEAFNEARYAAFKDPELQGFVEALEYSAILDDRTTEICQELDGFTANTDSEEWDTFRPPNHYNCRSVLVPVTQVDGWDGQDDPDPAVQPQVGFGTGEK